MKRYGRKKEEKANNVKGMGIRRRKDKSKKKEDNEVSGSKEGGRKTREKTNERMCRRRMETDILTRRREAGGEKSKKYIYKKEEETNEILMERSRGLCNERGRRMEGMKLEKGRVRTTKGNGEKEKKGGKLRG